MRKFTLPIVSIVGLVLSTTCALPMFGQSATAPYQCATDLPTDSTVQLNLQDPDSMTLDPLGNIVLDSQADQELMIVSNPGESISACCVCP